MQTSSFSDSSSGSHSLASPAPGYHLQGTGIQPAAGAIRSTAGVAKSGRDRLRNSTDAIVFRERVGQLSRR